MDTQRQSTGARIFRNSFLESLTKTSPKITLVFYSAAAALLITAGIRYCRMNAVEAALTGLGGFFFWTLFEYFMHRYVFHIDKYFRRMAGFQFVIHGIHHDHPRDEERVFMPPVPGTIIVGMLLGLNYLVMGKAAFFFTGGMTTGYLVYSRIHHAVHNRPPVPRFRLWWKHHALHHYKYPDKAFGVSSPLWDIVFGTMPPEERKTDPRKKEREAAQ